MALQEPEAEAVDAPPAATETILVVDDEPDVRGLIERRFRKDIRAGHMAFQFAADGAEALEVLARTPDIDIVLCDINMPGMDGLTLLRRIADDGYEVKTIMVSAYGDMPNLRSAMNRGAFDFVTKPIDFGDLRATIDKTIAALNALREMHDRRAEAEQARANLERYFAPNLVETLVRTDDPFGAPREQPVAVLFADMIQFTRMCESLEPAKVFELLRQFHGRLAEVIFSFDGTLDKYIGDELMAVFGCPQSGPQDATQALCCAVAMRDDVDAMNAADAWVCNGPVDISVGVHYGPAFLGNIGDARRLEFATVGKTVNLASRLEGHGDSVPGKLAVSDAVIQRVRQENPKGHPVLERFAESEPVVLRGMDTPMPIWSLKPSG